MLDDLKYIHQKDPQDALGVAGKQAEQLKYDFGLGKITERPISNIVWAGMGGSAWPALFVQDWPGVTVPFELVRNYELPAYVGENTLVITSSYSGNTEETLAALAAAEAAGAVVAVMASGGKLAEAAQAKNLPHLAIPTGFQPRMSSMYFWTGALQLLEPLGLVPAGSLAQLQTAADWLAGQGAEWRADVPTSQNVAKQLAQEAMGKTVIVYAGPKLFPAAHKWKICINENAKHLAWSGSYPEFNHNEFIGWSEQPVDKPFLVIEIRSSLEHERIQKRFEVSERLLSGRRPSPEVVVPQGDDLLQQLLWTMALGDHVSIYLALLNGIDPTPVGLVEKLKVELG